MSDLNDPRVFFAANAQFRVILRTLTPVEIPQGHRVHQCEAVNYAVAALGAVLTAYLFVNGANL